MGSIMKSLTYPIRTYKTILLGCRVFLGLLKKRSIVFDVTLHTNTLPKFAKASGTYCHILNVNADLGLVLLKLPSLKKKYFSQNSIGTLGRNSNIFSKFKIQGNAGFNYIKGKKPIVRGVAMNPVDHPHGGRTKTNKPEVSP
jgi:large subunit ribosomal protein L2